MDDRIIRRTIIVLRSIRRTSRKPDGDWPAMRKSINKPVCLEAFGQPQLLYNKQDVSDAESARKRDGSAGAAPGA